MSEIEAGKRRVVTLDQVRNVFLQMCEEGEPPGTLAVCARIGYGSRSTVQKLLEEVRLEFRGSLKVVHSQMNLGLDQSATREVAALRERIMDLERDRRILIDEVAGARSRSIELEQQLDQSRAQLAAANREYTEKLERLTTQHADLAARVMGLATDAQATEKKG